MPTFCNDHPFIFMQTTTSQITIFLIITTAIILLLVALVIGLLYLYQKRQIGWQEKLSTLKLDFEKNSLQTQIEVQEQTFQHISREIHDNINLSLTLAKLNLNTLDWKNPEKTKHEVKSSVVILSSAISDLSNLSKSINTELITDMGLIKAVKSEAERIKSIAHLEIGVDIKGEPVYLESRKELIIFRIIQEALNNVIKHAKATKVCVGLDYQDNFLKLAIQDNGIGFSEEEVMIRRQNGNAGLKNMQTRTQLFGGDFMIETKAASGTRISVTIPY